MIYDVVVVGAGPAGLAAALNASIRNKKVLVLGPEMSEKLKKTAEVQNVLGMPDQSGEGLLKEFRSHVEEYPVEFINENATMVYDMGKFIGLLTPGNRIIEAHAVVYAPGVSFGKPLPGESNFLGKGVGTCATCDAALYRDRPVVVVGYNESAIEEANFMAEMASSTIFINQMGREVGLNPNIEVITDKVIEVRGDTVARSIVVGDREIEADGFFFIRDAQKPDAIVPGIELEGMHIQVNNKMETNLPGIFAAGDCTGLPYQISRAIGQGQVAGLNAASFATKKAKEASAED